MAQYFHDSVLDYGWCSPSGTIHSALTEPYVRDHQGHAARLKLGGRKNAITLGWIRWALSIDSETLFVEHRTDLDSSRPIERLIASTGAREVIKEHEVYAI